MQKTIDIIVPVRNDEENVPLFVHAVNSLSLPACVSLGIVFVEDSSTDNTLQALREVARTTRNVSYYSLEEGFGEGPAVVFGMSRSKADAVMTMESGGGHPVSSIPALIAHYLDGAEIVQAVRLSLRNRKWYRTAGTAVITVLLRLLTGFDAKGQNVYFRLLSKRYKDWMIGNRKCITSLRFKLPDTREGRVARVYFDATDRIRGTSTYSFTRLAKLAVDFALSVMPVSLLYFVLAITLVLALFVAWFVSPWLLFVFAFFAGAIGTKAWRLWNNRTLEKMTSKEQYIAGG